MVKLKIFEAPYCEIFHNDDEGVLYARWNGFLNVEQVTTGCKKMTEFISKNDIKLHLSDHRELKVLSKEVQGYLVTQWFPEVEKEGLLKVAALVSENAFAKATVDKVNHEAQVGELKINTFPSQEQCIRWLKSE